MKLLSNLDLSKNQLLNSVLHLLAADPGSPVEGQIYFNTATDKVMFYNGTSWLDFSGSGNGTVTAIGVTTANGVSASSSGGATPNLTITLGAIVPTSVAASGTVTGSNLSGTNTGDQTTITGNAGTATSLAGGTSNQRPYQTGAGVTAFYSSANYGVTVTGSSGVPQTIAGAAGVLVGSASAIPAFSTAPTLTGTNFTGIPNAGLTNSSLTIGSTSISLGGTVTTFTGLTSVTSTTFVGALTGNATTATTLATPRNINGTSFNGSADITVTAAAGTLTGTTLNSTVVTSSLTSVGTLGSLAVTGNITINGTPSSSTDAATKGYVDGVLNGLTWKTSVKAASTADVTISNPGTAVFDGVTLSNGQRILLKNQSTASQNGIYIFNGSGSAMTRAPDADSAAELNGAATYIEGGTVNADTAYTETALIATLGTDAVTWAQFAATGAAAAGTLTGTTLAANVVSSSLTSVGTLANLTVTNPITGSTTGNTKKYATDFGNGSLTSFTITHNLNTRDVTCAIYETSGSYNQVGADIAATTVNTVTVTVAVAPTSNQYRITVIG